MKSLKVVSAFVFLLFMYLSSPILLHFAQKLENETGFEFSKQLVLFVGFGPAFAVFIYLILKDDLE